MILLSDLNYSIKSCLTDVKFVLFSHLPSQPNHTPKIIGIKPAMPIDNWIFFINNVFPGWEIS